MKKKKPVSYISQLIEKEKALDNELKKMKKVVNSNDIDEKRVFVLFKELINRYPANHEVLKCFLGFLQSLNDEDLFKKFSLKDISRFYKRVSASNKFDIELNMDFFYFMYNVLDNEAGSLKLYKIYKKTILSVFKEFEERIEK
jgi:hypothetical protein